MSQYASQYAGDADRIRKLVREAEVHRDVFIDEDVFQLEMNHLFANTWVYVGHDSQVANEGDFYTTAIGSQPVVMVRHSDGAVKVLLNRCPHKGVKIAGETCGNTGKVFRCPYHAWRFRTDGIAAEPAVDAGLRQYRLSGFARGAGHDAPEACAQLSRLRFREAERRGPGLRGLFRAKPVELRQHD